MYDKSSSNDYSTLLKIKIKQKGATLATENLIQLLHMLKK